MSAMTAVAVEPFGLKWDGDGFEAGILALGKDLKRVPLDEVLDKANRVSKRKGAAGTGGIRLDEAQAGGLVLLRRR